MQWLVCIRRSQVLKVGKSFISAGVPATEKTKVLGVVLDRCLTFESHVTAVARACNYNAQAIRHVQHCWRLSFLWRWRVAWYCPGWTTAMLCCIIELQPVVFRSCCVCRALQHESFSRHRGGLTLSHYWNVCSGFRSTREKTTSWPHWPTRYSAHFTFIYISRHIRPRDTACHIRSFTMLSLHKPTTRTHFTDRAYRCAGLLSGILWTVAL